jgi:MFS family permease
MRNFTLPALLIAEAVSSTGSAITFVALPWFVLSTGGSATRMSIVLAAEILPMALFGIPSGSVVARLGARTTMLISDLVRAPLVALVPILHWSGHLTFGGLLVIVFLLGLFTAPYMSSQRTILPEIFGDDENGKRIFITGGAGFIGTTLARELVDANEVVAFDNLHRDALRAPTSGPPELRADPGRRARRRRAARRSAAARPTSSTARRSPASTPCSRARCARCA